MVLIGILCLRGCMMNMSRFNPFMHCCRSPMSTYFMDLGGHLKQAHENICLLMPITFQTCKEVLMDINISYFNVPLKFP